MTRPSWDEYFMTFAHVAALRSTCTRKQVGAVLVRDNYLLATGYGGSVAGQPHCTEAGCDIDPKTGGCVRTVHAEVNVVLQAAKHGVSTEGSTLYCTLSPCAACFKLLVNGGVKRIVYSEQYRIAPDRDFAAACGVELVYFAHAGLFSMSMPEVQRLLFERKRLYEQLTELQANNTALVLRLRHEVKHEPATEEDPGKGSGNR